MISSLALTRLSLVAANWQDTKMKSLYRQFRLNKTVIVKLIVFQNIIIHGTFSPQGLYNYSFN